MERAVHQSQTTWSSLPPSALSGLFIIPIMPASCPEYVRSRLSSFWSSKAEFLVFRTFVPTNFQLYTWKQSSNMSAISVLRFGTAILRYSERRPERIPGTNSSFMLDVFASSADTMDPLTLGLSNHETRRVGRRSLTAQLDAILTILEPDGQFLPTSTNLQDGNLGEGDTCTRMV